LPVLNARNVVQWMRERVMPLERAKVEFLGTGLQGMGFLMRDGTKEVPCRVSIEALSDRGL
jgi:hypothetical protein